MKDRIDRKTTDRSTNANILKLYRNAFYTCEEQPVHKYTDYSTNVLFIKSESFYWPENVESDYTSNEILVS